MSYGKICPILSINGYLDCKKNKCQLWLEEHEECAIQHNTPSAVYSRLADALARIAAGITYSPSTEAPSISESTAMVSAALDRIANAMEATDEN